MIPNNLSFLIVDDFDAVQHMVKTQLTSLGFKGPFHYASSGKQATQIIQEMIEMNKPIQFIISDLVMPNGDGLDLLKKVREIKEHKNTPFVMLTSQDDRDSVMKALEAGASNYLIKPWSQQSLSEKIAYCWEKHFGTKATK